MTLEQLEAINAIVDFGSFRAAAEKLNRSQPALSATIKQLEDEFGLLIFDRSAYRPKLTEQGLAFLGVAKLALASAQHARRVAIELGKNQAETKLRISVDPLISSEVIEIIAQECARPTLPVNLIIERSILKGSYEPLLKGDLDLAIGPRPNQGEGLNAIHLENVVLVGVVSRRLLQEKKKPSEAFLGKHPQILVYDKKFDEPTDGILPKNDHHGHKIYVPDHATKLKLIEGGVGWGRISKIEFEQNKELVAIDKNICVPVHLELCLLQTKIRPIGPIARAIWSAFENRARNK